MKINYVVTMSRFSVASFGDIILLLKITCHQMNHFTCRRFSHVADADKKCVILNHMSPNDATENHRDIVTT